MSKTQLTVLWAGISVLVLMGVWPPTSRGGYDFIVGATNASVGRLMVEWVIVGVLIGGLIYSLKGEPDLLLKIYCRFSQAVGQWGRSYQDILTDTKNNKTKMMRFWVVVLLLLLCGLLVIRLSMSDARAPGELR